METKFILNREKIFYIILWMYIVQEVFFFRTRLISVIGTSLTRTIVWGFRAVIIGLVIIKLFFYDKHSRRGVIILAGIMVVLALSSIVSHSTAMLLTVLVIISSDGVDFEKIVRFNYRTVGGILLLTILLNLAGIIPNATKMRNELGTIRSSLGFYHPNTLALVCFLLLTDYLYINRNKGLKKLVFAVFIAGATFFLTYGFTAMVLMALLIAVIFFQTIFEKKNFLTKHRLRIIVFLVLIVFAGFIYYFWNHPELLINEFRTFRGRFTLSQKYIRIYGIKPFGNRIQIGSSVNFEGYGSSYGYLDNGMARILVELGIIFFVIFFGSYILAIRKKVNERNTTLVIILLVYLVYGFMEYNSLTLAFNIFILSLRCAFDKRNSYQIEEIRVMQDG